MATKSRMLQFYVNDWYDSSIMSLDHVIEQTFLIVDPDKKIVIREIAAQEFGGIAASNASGVVPIGWTDRAFARVKLVFAGTREKTEDLFAPSHVPSPEFLNVIAVILRLSQAGCSVTSPGHLVAGRVLAGHVYLDELD